MDKLVTIHQSNLFPRLKVLTKLALSDVYLLQNDVQYARRDWQNRFQIQHRNGVPFLVSVPVHLPHGRSTWLSEVQICEPETAVRKLRDTMRHTYRRAPFWRDVEDYLDEVLYTPVVYLSDLAGRSVRTALARLAPDVVIASYPSLPPDGNPDRSWRLAAAARAVGGTSYLSGSGGRRYTDLERFRDEKINVYWQDWETDTKIMKLSDGSVKPNNLSVLHYMANIDMHDLRRALSNLKDERRRRWDSRT